MTDPVAPPAFHRILPGLDPLNRAYWTGGARGELLIARCQACALYLHPPMPRCTRCGGTVHPEAVSGKGRVASFTINRQSWLPGMPTPFVFAAVELDEQPGLYVFTNVVDCPIETVGARMAVHVVFEAHGDVYLPMFAPIGSTTA